MGGSDFQKFSPGKFRSSEGLPGIKNASGKFGPCTGVVWRGLPSSGDYVNPVRAMRAAAELKTVYFARVPPIFRNQK